MKKINGVVHWDVESSPSGKEYAITVWATYQQGIYYWVKQRLFIYKRKEQNF